MGQRKDFLIFGLAVFLIAAWCVLELWLWATGIETPEKGTPKRWIALVLSILFLGAIISFLALLVHTFVSRKLSEKMRVLPSGS